MTIIGMKELRQNIREISERVQKGERFTVVKRSKPMFSIVPTEPEPDVQGTRDWTREYVRDHRQAFDELAQK